MSKKAKSFGTTAKASTSTPISCAFTMAQGAARLVEQMRRPRKTTARHITHDETLAWTIGQLNELDRHFESLAEKGYRPHPNAIARRARLQEKIERISRPSPLLDENSTSLLLGNAGNEES